MAVGKWIMSRMEIVQNGWSTLWKLLHLNQIFFMHQLFYCANHRLIMYKNIFISYQHVSQQGLLKKQMKIIKRRPSIREFLGRKGKAIKVLHVFEDHLWEMGSKAEPKFKDVKVGGSSRLNDSIFQYIEGEKDESEK